MPRWPADNQSALLKFYGTPGPEVERQLVDVVPPFKMYYDGKPIKSIRFHRKCADALRAALDEIWEHYDRDQTTINKLGISKYAGSYNPRKVRGSATKWSNHAYGAAIDLNASENGFGKGKGNIPQPVVDAFKRQGARWGGDYKGRTDPMHFEFCDAGYSPATFADLTDTDSDSQIDYGDQDEPKTFWEKAKNWILGGGGLGIGGLGWLGDVPPVVWLAIILAGVFLVVYFNPPRWWRKR